jgi:acyl carrier protein
MALHDELRQFVTDNFMFGKPFKDFGDDDSFIERGIIDSTAVMELVAFLEERYHIRLQDRELIPDNFDSINRLAQFVARRLQTHYTDDLATGKVVPETSLLSARRGNGLL